MFAAHVRRVVYIIGASLIGLDHRGLDTLPAEGEDFVAKRAATHTNTNNLYKVRIGHCMNVYGIMEVSYKITRHLPSAALMDVKI